MKALHGIADPLLLLRKPVERASRQPLPCQELRTYFLICLVNNAMRA